MKKLCVIAGPTACGKTAVAVSLARRLAGEVVSADSMAVYRGMDIGTAKPTWAERQGVPHHMLDVADPDEPFSTAVYAARAAEAVRDIHRRGLLPIVAGGTGFYINALRDGTDFADAPGDDENRRRLMQMDAARVYALLCEADPVYAAAVHPHNHKRTARALSFYQTTGQRLSEHNAIQKQRPPQYDSRFFLLCGDRAALYARIDRRVEAMARDGLAEEVRGLLAAGYAPALPSMQGIGYKETVAYLQGAYDRAAWIARIQQATRNYAKRQLTWFTHQAPHARRVDTDGKTPEEIAREIERMV